MTTPTALTAIHRAALNLVTEAQRCGVVVTIETTPHQPLAMDNHDMSVSVREARRPPPHAANYAAGLSFGMSCLVLTAIAQAKRIIEGNGSPSDLAQDRRDLPETLSVLRHAVQYGLASLTDPSSTDYARELQALRKKVATYEARDALGLVPQPAGALGPDGKEWAKTAAGYQHVEAMLPRADGHQSVGPYWYGWALRGAFVAGAEWQEARNPHAPAITYLPLTLAEARDLTCMLAGAPWPDEMLPELQQLLGIYDGLRAHGQRPVDPATLPRKVAKAVMKTGLLPATPQQPAPSAAPAVDEPDEVTKLRALAATCYAGLGAECNLPENWLDALNAAANGEPFTTAGLLPFKAEPSETSPTPSALATIEQALRDYHFALDSRQHGGVAADQALSTIAQTMGMRWKQGDETARRAAQLKQEDKAA